MGFAENLKKYRKSKKLTQGQLSEKINVSFRTVQNYESGRTWPKSKEVIDALCAVLDVTCNDLFNDEDAELNIPQIALPEDEDIYSLVSKISGLFAGNRLPEEDKDAVMSAILEAYKRSKSEK